MVEYPQFILNDINDDLIKVYDLIKNNDIETIKKNRLLDINNTINGNKDICDKMFKEFHQSKDQDIYQHIYFQKIYYFSRIKITNNAKFTGKWLVIISHLERILNPPVEYKTNEDEIVSSAPAPASSINV